MPACLLAACLLSLLDNSVVLPAYNSTCLVAVTATVVAATTTTTYLPGLVGAWPVVEGKVKPIVRGRGGRRNLATSAIHSGAPALIAAAAVCVNAPASSPSPLSSVLDNSPAPCGTCKFPVVDEAVGCDRCEDWFHPLAMCLGLPECSIRDIIKLEGEGIHFVCLKCCLKDRSPSKDSNSNRDGTVKQLSEMVMALCSSAKVLTSQMESLQKSVESLSRSQPPPHLSTNLHPPNILLHLPLIL